MFKIFTKKDGYTLLEISIAMALFTTITVSVVGFFIILSKLLNNYKLQINMGQEIMIVSEIFTRDAREATSVNMIDSNNDGKIDLCNNSNETITLTFDSGNQMEFRCEQDPNIEDINQNLINRVGIANIPGGALINITSDDVSVDSFRIYRPTDNTYPKTLAYDIELHYINAVDQDPGGGIEYNSGDKLNFRGFINMRNEQ